MNIYRLSFPLDEGFSLSLDSNIDNESKKSNSHYYSWQCDRSDLGSIDSSIFKNSLHQSSLDKSNSLRTDSTKIVSRAEIHADGTVDAEGGAPKENNSININEDTESGITIIEIKDRKASSSSFRTGPTSSVISYDSIYLSSESDRQTVLDETIDNLADIDAKIKDFEQIIKELNVVGESTNPESIIDNLYSQVGKGKADAKIVEPKINPDTYSKYTDYISKGTLERLTILSGYDKVSRDKSVTEFQYSSLPDAGISKLLRDCELIDAKLRDDVELLEEPYPDYDSLPNELNNGAEVDSLEHVDKSEVKTEPISLEENPKGAPSIELVQLPTIEAKANEVSGNTTKIYLPEIGVEFDYENSIASFDSDSDFESPPAVLCKAPSFNLVTVSGRKVIVDELAAKAEQKDHKRVEPPVVVVEQRSDARLPSTNTKTEAAEVSSKKSPVAKQQKTPDKPKKAHKTDKEKIKSSECKQQPVDKTLLFHLSTPNEANKRSTAVQSEQDCKSYRLLRRNCLSFNMPRPQLLSIIDSKNSVPKRDQQRIAATAADVKVKSDKGQALNQTEREFLHKVDSVRNYWSKMTDDDSPGNLKTLSKKFLSTKSSSDIPEALKDEDFQSFFPTVEIVELNGETQAALVTSRKLNDGEFDHVRYKVMKSDMFQKNLLVGNRKETQFDGLMQYLQDYSFQELLANNNVVIIEPVRTKIEKVSEKPNTAQSAACKITNGALNRNGSNNLKKHFFYHPIRVNKELYEEELPVPDTVRNVRKMFEGSLRRVATKDDGSKNGKTIRYLTIDTSFDSNNNGGGGGNNLGVTKWDSISLSSGVSSAADLNSPCECHESANKDIKFVCTSKENLDNVDDDDDGEFKSAYVSDDVMEKIRECGSSITYYGGQAMGKKMNADVMTKAIMREINQSSSQKCNCSSRRSSRQSGASSTVRQLTNDYAGD